MHVVVPEQCKKPCSVFVGWRNKPKNGNGLNPQHFPIRICRKRLDRYSSEGVTIAYEYRRSYEFKTLKRHRFFIVTPFLSCKCNPSSQKSTSCTRLEPLGRGMLEPSLKVSSSGSRFVSTDLRIGRSHVEGCWRKPRASSMHFGNRETLR